MSKSNTKGVKNIKSAKTKSKKSQSNRANDLNDIKQLTQNVSEVARLQVKIEDRKYGLVNVGPDFWYWTYDGRQLVFRHDSKIIVDQRTFESNIVDRDGWKLGHILMDNSILFKNDLPGDEVEIPINHITDKEILALVKDEDAVFDLMPKFTSVLTVSRILAVAEKNKRKLSNIVFACTERLFVLQNGLGDNFWDCNTRELIELAKTKHLPAEFHEPENDESTDDYRDRIVDYLKD